MKKMFKYASLGAIALVGAVSFSACSSSDEVVDNPNYNPEKNVVKTQFTIAFPDNVAKTRQAAGAVQSDGAIESFRGMDNIVLYPFAATSSSTTINPISSTSTKLGDAIALTTMVKPASVGSLDNTIPAYTGSGTGLTSASNSVLYNDVTIPVGTGSFLFYGKAIDNTTYGDFYNGKLVMSGNEPGNIKFDLSQINSASTVSTVGTNLATYLSGIAQAENWAGCSKTENKNESWYNAALGDLYNKFISLQTGSSLSVQAAVQDLYNSIYKNTDAVSIKIKDAILNSDYASDASVSGSLTFTPALGNSATTYFPGDVNLPDGAAMLTYNTSSKTFSQKVDGNGNTGQVTAKFADYVYPASLYYYCNSGIGTAAASQVDKYNGTNNWETILAGYTSHAAVQPNTRSVAILNAIQYAVGRLDMTIKTANNTLYDKKGESYNATAGFTVTGVLIGGQKQVVYDFTPTSTTVPTYTIYDNITKSQSSTTLTATTTPSATNYTLALETPATQPIYVAVELLNNGADFEGYDGVVPAGCKFYLVAQLVPSKGTGYNETTMNQIFKQDYYTKVDFTIQQGKSKNDPGFDPASPEGLGKAYNTIPDLRTPQLELGLSVDLTWQPGLTFNIDL